MMMLDFDLAAYRKATSRALYVWHGLRKFEGCRPYCFARIACSFLKERELREDEVGSSMDTATSTVVSRSDGTTIGRKSEDDDDDDEKDLLVVGCSADDVVGNVARPRLIGSLV